MYIRSQDSSGVCFLSAGYLLLLAFRWMHRGKENLENKITPRTKLVFIGGLWGMISIFVLIFSLIFPDSLYQKNYTEPDFKTAGYEKTATLLQFGLSGSLIIIPVRAAWQEVFLGESMLSSRIMRPI